jgi:low temperature requirement protein LtrA
LWQAPRLRVGEETGRHATWLELFFDRVFVVAIAALAGLLHDDLSLGGFFAFSLLFVPVGWAWMSFATTRTSSTRKTRSSGLLCSSRCWPRPRSR